jgi:hypothetical protein
MYFFLFIFSLALNHANDCNSKHHNSKPKKHINHLIMKKVILNIAFIAISASLLFSSCKKNEAVEPDYSELSQQSGDNSSVQRESDQAVDDANKLLEGSSLNARLYGASSACDIDSSKTVGDKKYFVFKYKGISVDGKIKSGKMTAVLTKGTKWSDKDAVLTLTFDTLKVTRNGKSVTFNGTKTITNVTGGRLKDVTKAGDVVVHTIEAKDLKITFEDGTSKTWSITKTRTFTYDSGLIVSTAGAAGTGLAEFGTTRKGTPFTCIITNPIVFKDCGGNDTKPISGQKVHKGLVKEVTVTFGVDASGNAVNNCNATGFKVNWLNRKGETQTVIGAY